MNEKDVPLYKYKNIEDLQVLLLEDEFDDIDEDELISEIRPLIRDSKLLRFEND